MNKLIPLPSISNVAAGSTAVLTLPVGPTYNVVYLTYSGVTLAQLENICVKINGKEVQRWTDGTLLNAINLYYGRGATASGILPIYFYRPELETLLQKRMFALGTGDLQTVQIEIDIDSGAASPVLSAHYSGHGIKMPMGVITKVKMFPRTFATTGEQEIDNLPRSGARIAAIHCQKSDVSKIVLTGNSIELFNASKTLLEKDQKDNGRTPYTASASHVDFILEGDASLALSTLGITDLRLKPTIDTVGNVNVLVEYFDSFEGI